jgi:hypothetical protein
MWARRVCALGQAPATADKHVVVMAVGAPAIVVAKVAKVAMARRPVRGPRVRKAVASRVEAPVDRMAGWAAKLQLPVQAMRLEARR